MSFCFFYHSLQFQVITNDIANHQDDLDSLSEAADKIVAKEKPPEASKLKKKMEELARDWEIVRKKAAEKQSLLEDARKEVMELGIVIGNISSFL